MTPGKTFLRHLLFAVIVAAVGLCCTGCFCAETWKYVGTTTVSRAGYHWELSPEKDAIVASAKMKTAYNYLPFYGHGVLSHEYPAWTISDAYEKSFPLDPLPSELVRFYLDVEPDPDAKPVWWVDWYKTKIPCFQDNPAERVGDAPESAQNERWIADGETFRLRVRPEDMAVLSEPFVITIRDRNSSITTLFLLIPCAQEGNRYTMVTGRDTDFDAYLNPLDGKAVVQTLGEREAGPFGWCFRILAFPPAIVADTILLPYYAAVHAVFGLVRLQRGY